MVAGEEEAIEAFLGVEGVEVGVDKEGEDWMGRGVPVVSGVVGFGDRKWGGIVVMRLVLRVGRGWKRCLG
jgi:hypothetical protein